MANTEANDEASDGDPASALAAAYVASPMVRSYSSPAPGSRWRAAVLKLRSLKLDPWENFPLSSIPAQTALRHRYSAIKKKWVLDDVVIRMEPLTFDHGAMRECFRLKKLASTGSHCSEWEYASNYVAKRYIKSVERCVYFEDVRLQMDTKLWAEEYNRQNPPKKVDIFQLSVLEFASGELYHIEHYMEGNYRKYNSNSGFVDEYSRNTPQAFSHFTFERSGHRLLIIDIQGVDDLYTDPQMHTADGEGYGDGNLGPRGMALFFHSHRCNPICHWLGLQPFDLEVEDEAATPSFDSPQFRRNKAHAWPGTWARGDRPQSSPPLTPQDGYSPMIPPSSWGRERFLSGDSGISDETTEFLWGGGGGVNAPSAVDLCNSSGRSSLGLCSMSWTDVPLSAAWKAARNRTISDCSDVDGPDDERHAFHLMMRENHKPTCAQHPTNMDEEIGQSVLGQIHHELARHHENGRFLVNRSSDPIKWSLVLFHVRQAAQLSCLDALVIMASYSIGLSGDHFLKQCPIEPSVSDIANGPDYLFRAAESGHITSMLHLAIRLDSGADGGDSCSNSSGGGQTIAGRDAALWYQRSLSFWPQTPEDIENLQLPKSRCAVLARLGALYAEGGRGLDVNMTKAGEYYNEAGELAMSEMRGREAARYLELAEEYFSQVEEDKSESRDESTPVQSESTDVIDPPQQSTASVNKQLQQPDLPEKAAGTAAVAIIPPSQSEAIESVDDQSDDEYSYSPSRPADLVVSSRSYADVVAGYRRVYAGVLRNHVEVKTCL